MEFKQWLYQEKAIWRLSDIAKQSKIPADSQNLGYRAMSGFLGGINDVQKELLWGREGGPQSSSLPAPRLADFNQAYKSASNVYQGKAPDAEEDLLDQIFPKSWEEAKRMGEAVAYPQKINSTSIVGGNWDAALTQAFEQLLRTLSTKGYTPELIDLIRSSKYNRFLNPARPVPDATGTLNFEFVIPKPEYIK